MILHPYIISRVYYLSTDTVAEVREIIIHARNVLVSGIRLALSLVVEKEMNIFK